MEISKYNINYGNLDKTHVATLKSQIEGGMDIPIRYYKKDNQKWVIDGGHTLKAYQELGREPPVVLIVPFTSPEDMIALSRHCNVNRIVQKPITYTESIAEEVKLRLDIKDNEIMQIFNKFSQAKQRGEASVDKDIPNSEKVLNDIFKEELITVGTFQFEYLPLLKLPEEFRTAIDDGEMTKSIGSELAHISEPEKQKELGRIAQEEKLSVSELKHIKDTVKATDCSLSHATAEILDARAIKRHNQSHEGIIKLMRGKARENRETLKEGTLTEFVIKCLKCHKELTIQHIEPSGEHHLKPDPLTEPFGARITEEIDTYIDKEAGKTGKTRSRIATDLMRAGFKTQTKGEETNEDKTDMDQWGIRKL